MITRIPTPEALTHNLVGGKWPHGIQPVTVHFLKRTRQRRLNVTAALTRLTKLPPVVRYEGRLYMPDPKTQGGPFQEKHTDREYVWIVKAWLTLPEGTDPKALGLSVKPVAICSACSRQWTGEATLCPPCVKKASKADAKPKGRVRNVKATVTLPAKIDKVSIDLEVKTITEIPPPDFDTDPPPDTQSSPGSEGHSGS